MTIVELAENGMHVLNMLMRHKMIRTKQPISKEEKKEKMGGYMPQPDNCGRKPIMYGDEKVQDLCICAFYCPEQCSSFKVHSKELKKGRMPPIMPKIPQQKKGWRDKVKKEEGK